MNDTVIKFENVSKSFPLYHHITGGIKHFLFNMREGLRTLRTTRFEALSDISFEVKRGESFGIIGRNGAGKSTMLGLIAGVMKPTRGSVVTNGRISPLLELGAGFNNELTGRENIILNGILMGLTRREVESKLDEIVDFSELGDFVDQPIRVYSSGMLARLGFSVVSSLDPEILLIDEILAVGDLDFQKKCLDRMKHFQDTGVTMVFVSHSMENVKMICERAIWIDNHKTMMVGDAKEVVDRYVSSF